MKAHRVSTLSLLILVLLFSTPSDADGKYFPRLHLDSDVPNIPTQCALLSWREGAEILVVESAVDAKSPALAWVMPLPAAPSRIEEISPGFFPTLDNATAPRLDDHRLDPPGVVMWLIGWGILAVAVPLCWFPRPKLRKFLDLGIVLIFWLLFLALSRPLGVVWSGRDITIIAEDQVGSYDVTVLTADSRDALADWLRDQGFRQPDDAERAIIEQYLKEEWVFVAAKLTRGSDGLSRPHPLLFEFPSDSPVYPMKLTGTGSRELFLELFVAGDGAASHPKLERAFCQTFTKAQADNKRDEVGTPPKHILAAPGRPYRAIGHSQAVAVLGDSTVLTRLEATLTPEDMREDYVLTFTKPRRYVPTVYSLSGARHYAAKVALIGAVVSVSLAPAIVWLLFRRKGAIVAGLVGVAGSAACLAAAGLIYLTLTIVEAREMSPFPVKMDRRSMAEAFSSNLWLDSVSDEELWKNLSHTIAVRRRMPDEEIDEAAESLNPFTQEPRQLREYPGDCQIERFDGKVFLTFYDEFCIPWRAPLGIQSTRSDSPSSQETSRVLPPGSVDKPSLPQD